MRDFAVEFLKCVKFHGQFMEGVTPAWRHKWHKAVYCEI